MFKIIDKALPLALTIVLNQGFSEEISQKQDRKFSENATITK